MNRTNAFSPDPHPQGDGISISVAYVATDNSEVNGDFTDTVETLGRLVSSATGTIGFAGDKDWFRVELTAGASYQFDLEGMKSNGVSFYTLDDPLIQGIYDAQGLLIKGTFNDDGGEGSDSRVTFTPTVSGSYFVSAAAFGDSTGTYKLSVKQIADDSTQDQKTKLQLGTPAEGNIENPRDIDYFVIELEPHRSYQIDVEGADTEKGTLGDPYLLSWTSSSGIEGRSLADDNSGVGFNSRSIIMDRHSEPGSENYAYVQVSGAPQGETGTYTITVTEITDDQPPDLVPYSNLAWFAHFGAQVTEDSPVRGVLELQGDVDYFALEVKAGQIYVIDLEGKSTSTLADPLTLDDPFLLVSSGDGYLDTYYYDEESDGYLSRPTSDDNGGTGTNSRLEIHAEQDGTVILGVSGGVLQGTGTYKLSVSKVGSDESSVGGTADGAYWGLLLDEPPDEILAFTPKDPKADRPVEADADTDFLLGDESDTRLPDFPFVNELPVVEEWIEEWFPPTPILEEF